MPVARLLGKTVRSLLARRGFALSRLDPGAPATLEGYVAALPSRGLAPAAVIVADADPEPLKIFLARFRPDQTRFHSGPRLTLGDPPAAPFLFESDNDNLAHADRTQLVAFFRTAGIVILRAQLAQFHRGEADAADLGTDMAAHGLALRDVIHSAPSNPVRGATGNLYLVFERVRPEATGADSHGRRYRVGEATSHLTTPILGRSSLVRLTGRGSHGFAAGICNPGAIEHDGRTLLLARGETLPWPVQRQDPAGFVQSCRPTLLTLGDDRLVAGASPVTLTTTADRRRTRFEDFRLFEHQGRVYSNHSVLELDPRPERIVRPERLRTSVGISRFDPEKGSLTHLGAPALGRPLGRLEKNWAMVSTGDRVHLIYSFNPYRLYTSTRFPELTFAAAAERALTLPIPDDGLPLRNSINPVPYDSGHLLHVVHKVYPGKQYVFWAVLLDRATLLPTRIVARPVLRAGASAAAAIVYACAAVARPEHIELFAGLDDCGIGSWRLERAELDRRWSPIH